MFNSMYLYFKNNKFLLMLAFSLVSNYGHAQLDTKHYIPPMHGIENHGDLGDHYLVLGTPVSTTFNVTVKDGAGNLISTIPISNAASSTTLLGNGTNSPFFVSEAELNTVVADGKGLILTASEPFYANIRVLVENQAGSLTSKGEQAALGQDFRTGHMFNNSGSSDAKSNCFSVMATEDNTVVLISDINAGVIFYGAGSSGTPATTSNITVTLNAGESYVVSTYLSDAAASNNVNGLNGTHITSDKDIVVNCGSWMGGNALDGTSNTGAIETGKDMGIDQMVSLKNIGTEYVLIKGFGVDNERTFVIASEDNTQLYLNGSGAAITTINEGDYYLIEGTAFSSNDNLYFESSHPVYVTQTLNGANGYSYDNERQGGINFIPPVWCTGNKEVTLPNVDFIGDAYINIIANAGAVIQINGNVIGGAKTIPGTSNYVTYSISGYTGDVDISSTLPIRVALLNFNGNVGAAGFFSGFSKEINLNGSFQNNNLNTSGEIAEGCGVGTITIERHSIYAENAITVSISTSGVAQEGLDYSTIPSQFTLAAGQTEISFTVDALTDNLTEGDENVILTLSVDGSNCGETELEFIIKDVSNLMASVDYNELLCPGDDIVLNSTVSGGVEPYFYQWSTGASTDQISVHPETTSTYSLIVTDICEFDAASVSTIVEVPDYNLSIITTNDTNILCPYTPLVLASEVIGGLGEYTYVWSVNGESIFNGATLLSSSDVTTDYIISVTDQCGLEIEDTVTVTVITPLMELNINEDRLICPYEETELWVNVTGGLPPFDYSWDHSNETDSSVWVQPAYSTTYTVTVSDACATYEVSANPFVEVVRPDANFQILSNTVVNNLPVYFMNTSTGGMFWEWDFGNGKYSNRHSPGTTYELDGNYTVSLIATNDLGCKDTMVKVITIKPEFWFYAPNAFTPDGDSFNNTYSVSLIGAKEFEFIIFNRWGELIYQTNDQYFNWDGTYKNQLVEDGTYIYSTIITGNDNEVRQLTGHIIVLK